MDEATLISRFRALRVWHSGAWRTIAPRALPAGAVVPLSAGRAAPDQILILESLAASVEAAGALILGESPDAVAASARGMGVPPMRMAETAMPRDLTILTSGTEGQPKPVIVPWKTILSSAPTASQSDDVWLLLYSLTRFAGLAVLAHCLVNRQALVIPTDPADQQQTITEAISADANCISATPSWMRRLLVAADAELLSRWHPRQITLGGEAAPQSLLDQITQRWPDARLTHIYAATEAGTCFSVSDRREGIPLANWLRNAAGVQHVAFTPLPPVHRFPGLPQPLRWVAGADARRHNQALRDWAASRADVSCVDIELPLQPSAMADDGFHPGEPVYRACAEAIARHLAALDWRSDPSPSPETRP